MTESRLHRVLATAGKPALRLGLAWSFGINERAVEWALCETQVGYLFWTSRMSRTNLALRRALARVRN